MDRTERFYKIEMLIRSRECVSFSALLEALEVSPATLKRDLQYLRERMDAPIEYDADANGYRFGKQWGGSQPHELPGVWFNEKELHALLTMHQMLAGLDENGLLSRHLAPMFDKLTGMLGADETEAKELTQRVKLISTARRRVPSEYFETVGSAVVKRQRLRLDYRKRGSAKAGPRVVSPQRLVHYRNTWYLDAWCHQSEGFRRFALDALEGAELLAEKARTVSTKQLEAELDQGYGIFAGSQARQASLVFKAETAQWVSHEEWHPAQTSEWLPDGRWRLDVPFIDSTELLMDLLRHAGQVEVLAPADLRRAYAKRLRDAVEELS